MIKYYLLIFIFCIQNLNAQDSLVDKKIVLKKDLPEVVVTGQLSETLVQDAIHKIRIIGKKRIKIQAYFLMLLVCYLKN